MSRDADITGSVDVEYKQNGVPMRAEVTAARWSGDCRYAPKYTFTISDGVAELRNIEPDTTSYNWPANKGTRRAARGAVSRLPFVEDVVIPEMEQ